MKLKFNINFIDGIIMKDVNKIFTEFLKKKKLQLTEQRKKILDTFIKINRHLSVEELYDIIKKKNPAIGNATVFRTLKLLEEAGIARSVDFNDNVIRYEMKFGHEHHDHLICLKCGKYVEAVDMEIEKLQEKLCKKYNFFPQKHRLNIFGICNGCNK